MSKRTPLERAVDQELISKGKDALKDFDESQALYVPGRKRASKPISIRLPMDMIHQLRQIARQKGNIGYQQIIKLYLAESLLREGLQNTISDLKAPFPVEGGVLSATVFDTQPESGRLVGDVEMKPRVRWRRTSEGSFTDGYNALFNEGSERSHGS